MFVADNGRCIVSDLIPCGINLTYVFIVMVQNFTQLLPRDVRLV